MIKNQFEENGFVIAINFMSIQWINQILHELEQAVINQNVTGIRQIDKKLNSVSAYIISDDFIENAKSYLTSEHKLVRAILFNKTPEANWYVTWHQDRTVSVSEKFDDPEWKNWSVKENVLHVQPPLAVLENMVTIRIHLDDANRDNGCLKVISGSHQFGLISQDEIQQFGEQNPCTYCVAKTGDALIMRPHLLHASSKSVDPSHRRVLHLEFSDWRLPEGVGWA